MFEAMPQYPIVDDSEVGSAEDTPENNKLDKSQKINFFAEVENLNWKEVVDKILANTDDPIFKERKKEILDQFVDDKSFYQEIKDKNMWATEIKSLRGPVFESLVLRECNQEEDNSLLAKLILNCLRKPNILNIPKSTFRNPDYLGVIVDSEKKIAYIKGMYEVKFGQGVLNPRAKKQINEVYANIKEISSAINEQLQALKDQYNFDFIPEGGLRLMSYEDMTKLIVCPEPESDAQLLKVNQRRWNLKSKGWEVHLSVFSRTDVHLLAAKLISVYRADNKLKKEVGKAENNEEDEIFYDQEVVKNQGKVFRADKKSRNEAFKAEKNDEEGVIVYDQEVVKNPETFVSFSGKTHEKLPIRSVSDYNVGMKLKLLDNPVGQLLKDYHNFEIVGFTLFRKKGNLVNLNNLTTESVQAAIKLDNDKYYFCHIKDMKDNFLINQD